MEFESQKGLNENWSICNKILVSFCQLLFSNIEGFDSYDCFFLTSTPFNSGDGQHGEGYYVGQLCWPTVRSVASFCWTSAEKQLSTLTKDVKVNQLLNWLTVRYKNCFFYCPMLRSKNIKKPKTETIHKYLESTKQIKDEAICKILFKL